MVKLCNINGEKIIHEQTTNESLYILKEGILSCEIDGKLIRKIYPKDYFGEYSLIFDVKSTSSVVAYSDTTVCYQIPKNILLESLGKDFKDYIIKCFLRVAFSHSKIMKTFVIDKYFDKVYKTFEVKILKRNECVINRKNWDSDMVFVVGVGELLKVVTSNIYSRELLK